MYIHVCIVIKKQAHMYMLCISVVSVITITKTPFRKTLRTTCTIPCTQEAFSARFHGNFT